MMSLMLAIEEEMLAGCRVIALALRVIVAFAGASTPSRIGGLAAAELPQYTTYRL